MTRRATIKQLRAEIVCLRRDMWKLAMENISVAVECKRLRAIVERQDSTILALWQLLDQHADEAPSDCALNAKGCRDGEPACTASYAEGCGAYVGKGDA